MSKKVDFLNNEKKTPARKNNRLMPTKKNIVPKKTYKGSKTSKLVKTDNKKKVETIVPKRRGRRPKKILDDDSDGVKVTANVHDDDNKNNSAVILRLNVDPSKLNLKKPMCIEDKKGIKPVKMIKAKKIGKGSKLEHNHNHSHNDEESSDGMFDNDIPRDNTCHKCMKNESAILMLRTKLDKYEKKDRIDKSNKVHVNKLNFISINTEKKFVIKKTNVSCWWDAHSFTTLPITLPETLHNDTYYVTGCFCSVNCALAYNLYYLKDSKIHHRKSLMYSLYREMYGLSPDDEIDIKEAPPKELLEKFGGKMSIDVFRRSFIMGNREYIIFVPPIKPISIMIEERNIEETIDNDDDLVIKRSKPLTKKRSIISSMGMK